MLPKKLFCPKCLHPDRDLVFKNDFDMLFNYICAQIGITSQENEHENIKKFDYATFKFCYKDKRMSMLHFSRSKEENAKEYHEVLFGEIQEYFFLSNDFEYAYKIFSLFMLYSIYFTQNSNIFYQINTIPDYLDEINNFIKIFAKINHSIAKEMYFMMKKLYDNQAFSIGAIIGLKTIILNKYGLPIEQKTNVFKDYLDIYDYSKEKKIEEANNQLKNNPSKQLLDNYIQLKQEIVKNIKELDFDKDIYCNFLNKALLTPNDPKEESPNFYKDNYEPHDGDILPQLKKEDLDPNKVTNFDCLFNNLL